MSKIIRTQNGDLLLKLGETGEKSAESRRTIREVLGVQGEFRTITHECKGIYENTTKDIVAGIGSQFDIGEVVTLDTVSLRKAYGGTQTVAHALPVESANKFLEAGKIKIGCHISEQARNLDTLPNFVKMGSIVPSYVGDA